MASFTIRSSLAHAIAFALWCSTGVILYSLVPASTASENSVRVQFGPLIYNIPKNYIAGVTQAQAPNSYAAFTVRALLPDLSPRTSENARQFDEPGWHNKFSALFEYGRHPRSPEEVLEFYLKDDGMGKADFRSVGSGYKLYQSPKSPWREIYTKETPNGLLLFVCGTTANGTPFPSCTVNEVFGKDVGVIYHFGRNYLNQASDIDLKLRALLKSFETKLP